MASQIYSQKATDPVKLMNSLEESIEQWREEIEILNVIASHVVQWVGKKLNVRLEKKLSVELEPKGYRVSLQKRSYSDWNDLQLYKKRTTPGGGYESIMTVDVGPRNEDFSVLDRHGRKRVYELIDAREGWIDKARKQLPILADQCERWNRGLELLQQVHEESSRMAFTFYLE